MSSSPTWANLPAPPKPIVPRPNTETRSPERPSCRCSMKVKLASREARTRPDGQDHCGGDEGKCPDYLEAELVPRHVRRGRAAERRGACGRDRQDDRQPE